MARSFAALLLVAAATAGAQPALKTFSHPDRIRYDGQCLTIDGKDLIVFSGSFHYFRCPKALWRDRFERIREAGCNAVETYVPWNASERNPPASPEDFSQIDLSDFRDWLRMAQDEFGFYTIVRPGPYICAEWDGGGFPRWLLAKMPAAAKRPSGAGLDLEAEAGNPAPGHPPGGVGTVDVAPGAVWLRSDDPGYLRWSEHWLEAVCKVVAPEQVTRRPPGRGGVILFQIENEYDLYPDPPEAQRAPYLRALYETAVSNGIEVPIFTCWTRQCRDSSDPELSQVFDAINAYPRYRIDTTAARIEALQTAQPDAPVMISELQGGWFAQVGKVLSEDQPGLTAAQINAHTLLALQEGATVLNYYMLFGGTNFGLWAGRGNITSYDYDAPIREPGGVGAKYLAVKAIGLMLRQYGTSLARSHPIICQAETDDPDVTVTARRSLDTSTYVFFHNRSIDEPRRGAATVWLEAAGEMRVRYDLGPFGSAIFYLPPRTPAVASKGVWLPKPVAGPERPKRVPAPIRLAAARMRADPGCVDWVPVRAGDMLPELGVYDARPVVYAAALSLSAAQASRSAVLRLDPYPGDGLVAEVNGHVVPFGLGREAAVGAWLRPGTNALRVLYEQAGQANFGRAVQDEDGLRGGALLLPSGRLAIGGWTLGRRLGGSAAGWPSLGGGPLPGWKTIALDTRNLVPREGWIDQAPSGPSAALATWYRVPFALPSPDPHVWAPWQARIDAAGDGEIFLNGHPLGRYWEAGPQRAFYLPECWLHFGPGPENVLTFRLSPMRMGVALRSVDVMPYADQAEVRP